MNVVAFSVVREAVSQDPKILIRKIKKKKKV